MTNSMHCFADNEIFVGFQPITLPLTSCVFTILIILELFIYTSLLFNRHNIQRTILPISFSINFFNIFRLIDDIKYVMSVLNIGDIDPKAFPYKFAISPCQQIVVINVSTHV